MNNKLFGTDGIRSCAGNFPLNASAVRAIGQSIGEKLGGRLAWDMTRESRVQILGLLKEGSSHLCGV
jgi:phosphomannomutase